MKQDKTFQYIIAILFILIMGIFAISYFFKGSDSALKIRESLGIAESMDMDTTDFSLADTIVKSDSKLGSDFFKFRTNYDSLLKDPKTKTHNSLQNIIADGNLLNTIDSSKLAKDTTKTSNGQKQSKQNDKEGRKDLINPPPFSVPTANTLDQRIQSIQEVDQIPRASILEILAISSKNILLGKNIEENEMILLALSQAQNALNIIVVDKAATIKYSNDKKLIGQSANFENPNPDANAEEIQCFEDKDHEICSVPIFHTYGRLGKAHMIYR